MSEIKRVYGWIPDSEEVRAKAPKLMLHPRQLASVPDSIDLSSSFPDAYDQLSLGSCTANMSAGLVQYDQKVQGLDWIMPSRLFDYYNSRLIEGTTAQDAGASISDAVLALAKYGWVPELLSQSGTVIPFYPYTIQKFAQQPPQACYDYAVQNKISDYARVQQDLNHLQATLAAGHPIGFGFTVYPYFESQQMARTGILKMPSWSDLTQGPVGGHAVIIVGYDNSKQMFKVRNSWNKSWGLNGYFWMPYAYALNQRLANDFAVINSIPGTKLPLDFDIVGD